MKIMESEANIEEALSLYICPKRRERQLEITRHYMEMVKDAKEHHRETETFESDLRSRAFLNSLLRDL
jgi:hypothetical protein